MFVLSVGRESSKPKLSANFTSAQIPKSHFARIRWDTSSCFHLGDSYWASHIYFCTFFSVYKSWITWRCVQFPIECLLLHHLQLRSLFILLQKCINDPWTFCSFPQLANFWSLTLGKVKLCCKWKYCSKTHYKTKQCKNLKQLATNPGCLWSLQNPTKPWLGRRLHASDIRRINSIPTFKACVISQQRRSCTGDAWQRGEWMSPHLGSSVKVLLSGTITFSKRHMENRWDLKGLHKNN